ncbi:prepilin peptidase [Nakamurella endophytica]|uniref:prepilin peptidase n=1 Tax=Nakamurella endophytica TaxID=1748367 RepID=UPI00166D88E9|nr:A24 family peptidase [Nakamurella endophytica]
MSTESLYTVTVGASAVVGMLTATVLLRRVAARPAAEHDPAGADAAGPVPTVRPEAPTEHGPVGGRQPAPAAPGAASAANGLPRAVSHRAVAVVAVIAGVLSALVAVRLGATWSLPAYAALAVAGVLLAAVDLREHRLPNRGVAATAVAGLALLAVASLGGAGWAPFGRALAGAAALFAAYLVLALLAPSGLGMGDVKLAGALGLYLGYLGWRPLVLGGLGGFVLVAVAGLFLLGARRADRRTQLAFGPAMVAAALITVLVHGQ